VSKLARSGRLSLREHERLYELETVIEGGVQTFVEVGLALSEIRDARLYRQTHGSFEAYCEERWGFSGRRGRQLMAAAEVGTIVPVSNEGQARELAPLLDEGENAVAEVWNGARADHGDELTAKAVRAAVEKKLAKVSTTEDRNLDETVSEHDFQRPSPMP
jgi:hypothetical protein